MGFDINNLIQGRVGFVDPDVEEKKKANVRDVFKFQYLPGRYCSRQRLRARLSEGGFGSLLGFKENKILQDGTNFVGDFLHKSVDWVFIHCDFITRWASDTESDVLFSLSTSSL